MEISREEYEQRVLKTLREHLLEKDHHLEYECGLSMQEVRLDTAVDPNEVQILFREKSRPECLFGYHAETVEWEEESSADPIVLDPETS